MATPLRPLTAILCAIGLWACSPANQSANSLPPPETVRPFDLNRYLGQWYEIARYPNRFQNKCLGQATAQYTANGDGTVRVVNSCRTKDGVESAEALARPADDNDPAKLEVRFAPKILSLLPNVWGDYWVIDLDPDYTLAAVSDERREYLWILARTPTVPQDRLNALISRLVAKGFDPTKLVMTSH